MIAIRSIGSVVLGLIAFLAVTFLLDWIASSVCPTCLSPDRAHFTSVTLLIVALVYWAAATWLAGLVAARVAPRAPIVHAVVVGSCLTLFFALNALGALTSGEDPVWWHLILVVLAIPLSLGGARMAHRAVVVETRGA